MSKYYLRVEGINLSQIFDDTQDLSTIRGSSLMLLGVIDKIGSKLAAYARRNRDGTGRPERIMSGASIGLWRIEAADEKAAERVAGAVREWLGQGAEMPGEMRTALDAAKFATFAVDIVPDDGNPDNFIEARETLMAHNRWRQMQEPSFIYPSPPAPLPGRADKRVCELDLKRPALADTKAIKGERQAVSQSVYARRGYGLKQKFGFYREEVEERGQLQLPGAIPRGGGARPFPMHFASIAEPKFPRLKPSLQSKIAVFYADGNKFTQTIDRLIGDTSAAGLGRDAAARQKALNEKLKDFRRDFLWRLLHTLLAEKAVGAPDEGEIEERAEHCKGAAAEDVVRIETLLWGGDEFLFALPARLGWRIAQLFFDTANGKDSDVATVGRTLPRPEPWSLGGTQLRHAAALVFCHHNAPIARIRQLAKEGLAEFAKDCDRERDLLMPLALESFDHIGADLDHFWNLRCPKGLKPEHLVIPGEALAPIQEAAAFLAAPDPATELEPFARRRLKALARILHSAEGIHRESYKAMLEEQKGYFDATSPAAAVQLMAPGASDEAVKQAALIYHLEELWDYLIPLKEGA